MIAKKTMYAPVKEIGDIQNRDGKPECVHDDHGLEPYIHDLFLR